MQVARPPDVRPYAKVVEAQAHTPVYKMHRYFARRPWNVFAALIEHYTQPGDVILDPFCGGGVTVVEGLRLGRRVVGVDLNPLATYVTEMEVRPLDLESFRRCYERVEAGVSDRICRFYGTTCATCSADDAVCDWIRWKRSEIIEIRYFCQKCGGYRRKRPSREDIALARQLDQEFDDLVGWEGLWYPKVRIPVGDKTESLLKSGLSYYHELFTKRNLLALALLHGEIEKVEERDSRDFLRFAFSSSLKWASKQSHLRGEVVEGWALHAYWIYPESLEINVWNTFARRYEAVLRGKRFGNEAIGEYYVGAESFDDISRGEAACLILPRSSTSLPIPDESVDVVITDPPYGGNVNYGELADYWMVWFGEQTIPKEDEIVINRTQGKRLSQYESLLAAVFRECWRVLKPGRCMVVTFNSKDLRVIASFVIASGSAGFTLHPDGLVYQPPISAYSTTFHAMQIGALTGDFIFTFVKEGSPTKEPGRDALASLEKKINQVLTRGVANCLTETELRLQAYELLIPFLASHAIGDIEECRGAVNYFEKCMQSSESFFKSERRRIVARRRRMYRSRV